MYLLLKIPGRRQAGSQYFSLSEFGLILSHVATGWLCFILSSWLNALMWKGYKQELKHEDLYATPEESLSQVLYRRFNKLVLPYSGHSRYIRPRGYAYTQARAYTKQNTGKYIYCTTNYITIYMTKARQS